MSGWTELAQGDAGDAIVAAMAAAGVDHVFFTSGSEIGFYQESIAKARALGRACPRLITVTHEHASLNAALGYIAVSGKPAVTAAHVDAGTLHHGGAIHTAMHAGLPVLITAGFPPTSYSGTSAAARNAGGHLWLQKTYDQHGIVRQYVKWERRLQMQDNPALVVSRALQVAMSEPCGPVYLSIPPEVSMQQARMPSFPSAAQLGLARPPAPDPEGVREIAERLLRARNPRVVVSGSGRNPATVAALVALCELLAIPYKGQGPMFQALLAGEVDVAFVSLQLALSPIKSGHLNVLATAGAKRSVALPAVPTVAESGFAGFEMPSWHGLFAPAGTPAAVVERLQREAARAVQTSEVRQRVEATGNEVVGSTSAEFEARYRADVARFKKIAKDAGLPYQD